MQIRKYDKQLGLERSLALYLPFREAGRAKRGEKKVGKGGLLRESRETSPTFLRISEGSYGKRVKGSLLISRVNMKILSRINRTRRNSNGGQDMTS